VLPRRHPLADRAESPNRLWRIIGAMNALTGRVDFLDDYIVGRAKVIKFYEQLSRSYPDAERLLVVQDNWFDPPPRRCDHRVVARVASDRAGLAADLRAVAEPDREAVALAASGPC